MKTTDRERFDDLVDEVLSGLPSAVTDLFDRAVRAPDQRMRMARLTEDDLPRDGIDIGEDGGEIDV